MPGPPVMMVMPFFMDIVLLFLFGVLLPGCPDYQLVSFNIDADILLFPDIHAGNLTYKTIVRLAQVKNGNILTGTKAPVILTSRSDSVEVKVNSIALAAVVAENNKQA